MENNTKNENNEKGMSEMTTYTTVTVIATEASKTTEKKEGKKMKVKGIKFISSKEVTSNSINIITGIVSRMKVTEVSQVLGKEVTFISKELKDEAVAAIVLPEQEERLRKAEFTALQNVRLHGVTFDQILASHVDQANLVRIIKIDEEEIEKAEKNLIKKEERIKKEENDEKSAALVKSILNTEKNIAWRKKQIITATRMLQFVPEKRPYETKRIKAFVNNAVYDLHEAKGVNIRTSSQLQKVFSSVKSNPFAGHQIPALVVSKYISGYGDNRDTVYMGTAQNCAASYMSQFIQEHISTEYLPGGLFTDRAFLSAAMLYINDIDAGQLVFQLEDTGKESEDGTRIYRVKINDLMLVRASINDTEKLVWAVKYPNNASEMILLESHKIVKKADLLFNADGTKRDAWIYTGKWGMSSAGAMKQNGLFLTGVYVGEDKSQVVDWKYIIDRLTCGGWSLLCGKKISYMNPQAIAQQSMRWAQALAPASLWTDIAPIPTFMNVPGKFTYVDPDTGKEGELIDGMYVVLATYIWHLFNEIPKIKQTYFINKEAAVGLLMQCRPWSVLKGTAMSITEEMMAAFIRQILPLFEKGIVEIHVNKNHVVSVNGKAPASEEQVVYSYYNYACSKGKDGEYGGKAVLIVYDNILDSYKGLWPEIEIFGKKYPIPTIISDFNGQKTGFDLRYESGMRILGFAHNDTEQGNTSVQTINGMLRQNPTEGYKFINEKGKAFIDEKFATLEKHTPEALDLKAIVDGIDYRSVLGIVAPDIVLKYYAPGLRSCVNTILKGVSTKISECKMAIGNVTLMLTVDPFVWLTGNNVLTVKEGITDIWTTTVSEGQKGIFNRFPKIMWDEILKVQNGHVEDIEIKALLKGINIEDVTMTISLMKSFCKGIVALPGMAFVAALIGGADFDGDKGKLNLEDTETRIMWDVTPTFINKGKGAASYDGKEAERKVLDKIVGEEAVKERLEKIENQEAAKELLEEI